jgi:hypothetical protein
MQMFGRPEVCFPSSISIFFKDLCLHQYVGTAVALPPDQTTNPNTEDRKMRTDGQTVKGNEMDMGKVKAWAKRTFSRERTSVAVAKLVVAGYAGIALAQVLQTY